MKTRTIEDQIKDLENTVAATLADSKEITQKSIAEGRDMDDEESKQVDENNAKVKRLNGDIKRLRTMQELEAAAAQPVDGSTAESAAISRAAGAAPGAIMIHRKSNIAEDKFQGQSFTRLQIAKALALIDSDRRSPATIAEQRWGKENPMLAMILKSSVSGAGETSGSALSELVQFDGRYTGDFVEFLYGMTVFDQLPFTEVPANVTVKGIDGAWTGYWVGEGKAIPMSQGSASAVNLSPLKAAALTGLSNEIIRDASPSSEMIVRDGLSQASAQVIDTTLLSASAASAGVSPAGLLNGVSGTASEGPSADGARQDIYNLVAPFNTAKIRGDIVLVTTPAIATQLGLMFNALGQPEFPGLSRSGGSMLGYKVVVGDNVPSGDIIAIAPKAVWKIGDLGVQVSVSQHATVEQSTVPTGDALTPAAASVMLTSAFQEDMTFFKVIRPVNFAKKRTAAVSLVTGAAYHGDYNA